MDICYIFKLQSTALPTMILRGYGFERVFHFNTSNVGNLIHTVSRDGMPRMLTLYRKPSTLSHPLFRSVQIEKERGDLVKAHLMANWLHTRHALLPPSWKTLAMRQLMATCWMRSNVIYVGQDPALVRLEDVTIDKLRRSTPRLCCSGRSCRRPAWGVCYTWTSHNSLSSP